MKSLYNKSANTEDRVTSSLNLIHRAMFQDFVKNTDVDSTTADKIACTLNVHFVEYLISAWPKNTQIADIK